MEGQRNIYLTYGSYGRAWQGDSGGPPTGGKAVLDPDFVQFMDENVFNR